MLSLFLRNLFFTILQPGVVAGFIPYMIVGDSFSAEWKKDLSNTQYFAIVVFVTGTSILLYCIRMFAVKGRGTLSPADPTRKLVIEGLYKYSRNPMYVGVILMLIGEAMFFSSVSLCIYAIFILIAFHVFILIHEEPRLTNDFGEEYLQYMARVRRWL